MITLRFSEAQWDPSWTSKPWYKADEFCEFHRNQGHDTNRCMFLIKVLQRFIDNLNLVFNGPSTNSNHNLGVFQNPLPQRNDTQVGSNLFSQEVVTIICKSN